MSELNGQTTVSDLLNFAKDTNSATAKIVMRNSSCIATAAIIVLNGEDVCDVLLPAIDKAEDEYENGGEEKSSLCPSCGNEHMHLLKDETYYCDECGDTKDE